MKTITERKYKSSDTIIPLTSEWASRKAEANTYISSAVQHMRTTDRIDNRAYCITAHTDGRPLSNKNSLSNKSTCIALYKAICAFLSKTYQGGKAEIQPQDKPGLIACKDVAGTRWDVNRGNFDAKNTPHIHATLFLPFEITDSETDIFFMHALRLAIEQVEGIKKINIGTSNGSVLIEKFIPNKPIWWLVDYSTKARRFACATPDFEPLVFPFQQRLEKYDTSKASNDNERHRFFRKRNTILGGQLRTVRNLTYNPKLFYSSDICCDFSTSHKGLLAENILLKPYGYKPTDRDFQKIIAWRGCFDNSKFGNEVVPSTANTTSLGPVFDARKPATWGSSLDGYIDESACRVSLGRDVLPPTAQQNQLMPADFWNYPSQHAWLKSQNEFYQRLAFWRLHFAICPLARFCSIYR